MTLILIFGPLVLLAGLLLYAGLRLAPHNRWRSAANICAGLIITAFCGSMLWPFSPSRLAIVWYMQSEMGAAVVERDAALKELAEARVQRRAEETRQHVAMDAITAAVARLQQHYQVQTGRPVQSVRTPKSEPVEKRAAGIVAQLQELEAAIASKASLEPF